MSKRMKKTMSMLLVVTLIAVIAVGGMLAYLTSEDSDVNVMTLGEVKIEQIEQERDNAGNLVDFTQAKPLYPAVYPGNSTNDSIPWADESYWPVAGNVSWRTVQDNGNVVDKFVTVKNTGKSDAYVRTIIAFEGEAINGTDIHLVCNGTDDANLVAREFVENVVINGVRYDVIVFTYKNALAAGETSIPSLKQIYMDHTCTNEDVAKYGETYDVLVLSQAVQTNGFADAQTALDTAFGKVAEKAAGWFSDIPIPYTVYSAEDLIKVLSDIKTIAKQEIPGTNGNKQFRVEANIILADDIVIDSNTEFMYTDSNGAPLHFYGMKGTLDLNGHNITVSEDALLEGKSYANATLLFQYSNVDIVGEGSIIAKNESIPVYGWANGTVDIYGGTYITNAYERNESAVYVNNSTMVINVYGGDYDQSKYAFNAHDKNCGNTPVIVLHEGVSYQQFLKDTTDVIQKDVEAGRIKIAE